MIMVASQSSQEVFYSSLYFERFVKDWYYLFLKCLIEFTSEVNWSQAFLCWEGFDYGFNILTSNWSKI